MLQRYKKNIESQNANNSMLSERKIYLTFVMFLKTFYHLKKRKTMNYLLSESDAKLAYERLTDQENPLSYSKVADIFGITPGELKKELTKYSFIKRKDAVHRLAQEYENWEINTWTDIVFAATLESYNSLSSGVLETELNTLMEYNEEKKHIVIDGKSGIELREEDGYYYIFRGDLLEIKIFGDEELAKNIFSGMKQGII